MNHLGKENSFSFQRTIHALNEGLKLIIRGGNEMEFLKEIFMFIGHLILLGLIFIPGIYILSLIVKILRNNTRK